MEAKVKIKNILLAFIFLYPISPWYITFGPLNLVNIVSIIFIGCWVAYSEISLVSLKKTSICFWTYMIVYSLQALSDTSLVKAVAYITAQLFVCLILFSEIYRQDILDEALDMMIYAGGMLSVTGILEEITKTNIFHIISGLPANSFYIEIRLGIYRIETSFSHPIVYCAYLCFIAGILVYRLSRLDNQKQVMLFRGIYVLVLLNALFTMSRSTLIVLFVEQLVLLYKVGLLRFDKKMLVGVTAAAVLVCLATVASSSIMEKIKDVWYMFLSLLDSSYAALYSTSFGLNADAVGNRMDLFSWVTETVRGNEFFGMGTSAEFAYTVHAIEPTWGYEYTWIKDSIENEYLYNYFIHGIVGLVTFIVCMIGSIFYAFKVTRLEKSLEDSDEINKKDLSFSEVILVLLIGYAFTLFFVRSSDNVRVFNVLMCLIFGYYINLKDGNWSDIDEEEND